MAFVSVKVGPKGQVVIPKVFRDEYGILPGDEILVGESYANAGKELIVKKNNQEFIEYLKEFAKKHATKNFTYDSDAAYEKMMEERFPKIAARGAMKGGRKR